MTVIAYIFIFGVMGGFIISAMYGLHWAIKRGQFADFERGALCIFDNEEPTGKRTDAFPGETRYSCSPRRNDETTDTTRKQDAAE